MAYLRVNFLPIFQYNRFIDTKSSLNMGSISWSHQTIGNVTAPGHNASRYCDIGGGPTLPVTQLSQLPLSMW